MYIYEPIIISIHYHLRAHNKLAKVIKVHVPSLLYGIPSISYSIKTRITANVKQEIKIISLII